MWMNVREDYTVVTVIHIVLTLLGAIPASAMRVLKAIHLVLVSIGYSTFAAVIEDEVNF